MPISVEEVGTAAVDVLHAVGEDVVSVETDDGGACVVGAGARHSDPRLTMNTCSHVEMADNHAAVESLPGLDGAGLAAHRRHNRSAGDIGKRRRRGPGDRSEHFTGR